MNSQYLPWSSVPGKNFRQAPFISTLHFHNVNAHYSVVILKKV